MTSCLRLCVHAPVKRAAIDFWSVQHASSYQQQSTVSEPSYQRHTHTLPSLLSTSS